MKSSNMLISIIIWNNPTKLINDTKISSLANLQFI